MVCEIRWMCRRSIKGAAQANAGGSENADPSAELNTRAKAILANERASTYSAAVRVVMAADPDLAAEYGAWVANRN